MDERVSAQIRVCARQFLQYIPVDDFIEMNVSPYYAKAAT